MRQTKSVCGRDLTNDPADLDLPEAGSSPRPAVCVKATPEPRQCCVPLFPALLLAAACHAAVLTGVLTAVQTDPRPGLVLGLSLLPAAGAATAGAGPGNEGALASGSGPSSHNDRALLEHAARISRISGMTKLPSPGSGEMPNAGDELAVRKSAAVSTRTVLRTTSAAELRSARPAAARRAARKTADKSRDVAAVEARTLHRDVAAAGLPAMEPAVDHAEHSGAHHPAAATAAGSGCSEGGEQICGSAGGVGGTDGCGSPGCRAGRSLVRFGDTDGPRFVRRIVPDYPEQARRRGREGLVVLRLTIGADGRLKDAVVVQSEGRSFERAALQAVRASEYAPAVRAGQSVECCALLPIRFALKKS